MIYHIWIGLKDISRNNRVVAELKAHTPYFEALERRILARQANGIIVVGDDADQTRANCRRLSKGEKPIAGLMRYTPKKWRVVAPPSKRKRDDNDVAPSKVVGLKTTSKCGRLAKSPRDPMHQAELLKRLNAKAVGATRASDDAASQSKRKRVDDSADDTAPKRKRMRESERLRASDDVAPSKVVGLKTTSKCGRKLRSRIIATTRFLGRLPIHSRRKRTPMDELPTKGYRCLLDTQPNSTVVNTVAI
jgi:hypothetical protein